MDIAMKVVNLVGQQSLGLLIDWHNGHEDPTEAIKLLEKIPSRSKKFKDAQKLLRKLKRKVKKN